MGKNNSKSRKDKRRLKAIENMKKHRSMLERSKIGKNEDHIQRLSKCIIQTEFNIH